MRIFLSTDRVHTKYLVKFEYKAVYLCAGFMHKLHFPARFEAASHVRPDKLKENRAVEIQALLLSTENVLQRFTDFLRAGRERALDHLRTAATTPVKRAVEHFRLRADIDRGAPDAVAVGSRLCRRILCSPAGKHSRGEAGDNVPFAGFHQKIAAASQVKG